MSFSDNLQALRKANNISQEQLAERLNVTRQTVSKWETGGYPEIDKIIALCDMFGCTMDELITGTVNVDKQNGEPIAVTESASEPEVGTVPEQGELTYTYTAPESAPYTAPAPAPAPSPSYDPTYVPPKQKSGRTAVIVAVTIVVIIAMLLVFAAFAMRVVFGGVFGWLSLDFSDQDISLFDWGGTKYSYANSSQYLAASDFKVSDSIDRIDVDWIKGVVAIAPADGDEIHIYEIADTPLNKDGMMRYRIYNGTIYIKFREPGRYWNLEGKSLVIEVPESMSELISLDIATVSADVASENMSFSDTDIDTVSGIITLWDYNTPELNIDTVSGGVTAYGNILQADIETVSGVVSVTANTSFSDMSINTVSGYVKFEAKSNFSELDIGTVSGRVELKCGTPRELDIDTVSGAIDIDGGITAKGGYTVNNIDGLGKVDIDTTSGDVTVKTK